MLCKRQKPEALVFENHMYVFGGFKRPNYLNSVEKLYLSKGKWNFVSSMFEKRSCFGVASLEGKIYVCGGRNETFLQSAEMYDPKTNQWKNLAPMNAKRCNFVLLVFEDKLYAIGGYNGESDLNSIDIYDPDTGKWKLID